MRYSTLFFRLTFIGLLLNTQVAFSQIIGSTENGSTLPKHAEKFNIATGSQQGNVNLFSGIYSSSYSLGTVSVPNGLSFTLKSSYSTSYVGGTHGGILDGIPYGDGRSLSLPTISVQNESFFDNTDFDIAAYFNSCSGSGTVPPLKFSSNDGTVYWHAPYVSIPGVMSGRAIYKHYDDSKQRHVFVLNAFERYAEIYMKSNRWTVKLDNGVEYNFNLAVESYRRANHRRSFAYNDSIVDLAKGPDSSMVVKQILKAQITPKSEFLKWYCSEIIDKSKPTAPRIKFDYETYGEFNYFKELSKNHQSAFDQILREKIYSLTSYQYDTNGIITSVLHNVEPNIQDYTVFKDVLLKRVSAHTFYGIEEWLDLEYETYDDHITNPLVMKIEDTGVLRKDSLYSYKSVFYQGKHTNSSQVYTPVKDVTSTINFTDWNRFLHAAHPSYSSNSGYVPISSSNPYIQNISTRNNRYSYNALSSANSVSMDHGFLSGTVTGSNILETRVPGDNYEIRFVVSKDDAMTSGNQGGFLNLDISIGAGVIPTSTFNNSVGLDISAIDFNQIQRTKIFSTFDRMVKWNVRGNTDLNSTSSDGLIVTSNNFTMPLFNPNDKLNFQIGPANSDHNFLSTPLEVDKLGSSSLLADAKRAYLHQRAQTGIGSPEKCDFKSIPHNFGVGLPWFQMTHVYEEFNTASPDDMYEFWWHNSPISGSTYANKPTLGGPNTDLEAIELIRYAKNPYMLRHVKKHVVSGIYAHDNDGPVGDQTLVRDVELDYTSQNMNMKLSIADNSGTFKKTFILLKSIRENPVYPTNNALQSTITTAEYNAAPTTRFEYGTGVSIGDTANYCTGGNCFFQFYFVPLSKEISHLGGETEIEYHAIQSTFSSKSSMVYLGKGQYSKQFNYQVKKLKKRIGDTTQAVWDYTYSGLDTKYESKRMVSADTFFTNNTFKGDMGAMYTIVKEPEVNGKQNTSKYYHYTSEYGQLLFGKLYKIEKLDPNNLLYEKTVIEYDTLLAFRNGFHKKTRYGKFSEKKVKLDSLNNPVLAYGDTVFYWDTASQYLIDTNIATAFHNYFWKYPYLEKIISHQAPFYQNNGKDDFITASDVILQPSHYTSYASKFYDGFYVKDNDPIYWDSWFIKKIKETTTEYDTNACVIDDSYYINSNIDISIDPLDVSFLTALKTNSTGSGVESDLIDNSPLSDTVLLEIIDTSFLLNDDQLVTVFGQQDNVKDSILKNLINRLPAISEESISSILIGQNKDHSHQILKTLVDRSSEEGYSAVRDVLVGQDSLTDSTLFYLLVKPEIPDSVSKLILTSRKALSDTVYNWLNDSIAKFGVPFLKDLVLAKQIFPNDNVLEMFAENANITDATLEIVFTACPFTFSSEVQAKLNNRNPALGSSVSTAISNAQTNLPTYANYLINLGNTSPVAAYVNLASENDLDFLFETLTDQTTTNTHLLTTFVNASPLEDTVLLSLIDYNGVFEVSTIESILNNQSGLTDVVWTKLINSTLYSNEELMSIINFRSGGFSDAVLNEILSHTPVFESTDLQNWLLKQPSISESVYTNIYGSDLVNSNIEPIHFKQRNFTATGLNAMLDNSREFSESNLTGVLLAQHNYPEKAVLLNLFNHTPAFSKSMIITILSNTTRELSAEVLSDVNTYLPGNYNSLIGVSNKFKIIGKAPKLKLYCNNPKLSKTLSISTVKEYEYYDANHQGITTSEGYKRVMNADVSSLQLLYEPSWQLYRTTSYSPELPGAKTEEENFYYYDLKHRYENLYWKSGLYIDSTNPYNSTLQLMVGVTNKIMGNHIGGLTKSWENQVRNISYENRITTQYASDHEALSRSTYFLYDTVWTPLYEPEDSVIYFTGDTCITPPIDTLVALGCDKIKVPEWGSSLYMSWNRIAFYKPGNPESIFYQCPCELKDTMVNHLGFQAVWAKPSAYMTWCDSGSFDYVDPNNPPPAQALWEYSKGRYLQLRSVKQQIDTIALSDYDDVQISNTNFTRKNYPILSFSELGEEVFPFETLQTLNVPDRNEYGQVKQEQNAAGLVTNYYYKKKLDLYYKDTNCYKNNYSGYYNGLSGLPYKVEVGTLTTWFTYYNDKNLKTITDPNGMTVTQNFDMYGRLKEAQRNGVILSKYNYHTWAGVDSLSFSERANENYSQMITLNKSGSSEAEQNTNYLDPMGRVYQNIRAVTTSAQNFTSTIPPYTHSGEVVYDALGRAQKNYRPFEYYGGETPIMNSAAGGSIDKTNHSAFAYEDGGYQRMLHEAKPGENISTGHTVDYEYQLTGYLCMFCDLNLSTATGSIMLPDTGYKYVFRKITITDEDGKQSTEYQNAMGQKVATKGRINNKLDAVTLFVYDAYGNLTKTINPNGQQNNYYYNILGWMYKQVTPDGGIKKLMYNKMGQVVIEMDQKDTDGWLQVQTSKLYKKARHYIYDSYSRLIKQSRIQIPYLNGKVTVGSTFLFDPLLYSSFEHLTGEFKYDFSNTSSMSWMAQIDAKYNMGVQFPPVGKHNIYTEYLQNLHSTYPEKTWNYLDTNYNRIGRLFKTESFDHEEGFSGNNSRKVQVSEIKYNAEGQISELHRHFLPNDTVQGQKGMHILIDYPEYDLRGNPLTVNVDVNVDSILDIQYHYTYDAFGRMDEVYGNFSDQKAQGNLLARYIYDNPTGMVKKVVYSKNCESFTQSVNYTGSPVDTIVYAYDIRNRLTNINSRFYDEVLHYDGNNPSKTAGAMGSNNYNGNINGIENHYRLNNAGGGLFDDPSKYGFTYDGLNRLTTADAFCSHWNSISTGKDDEIGDVKYNYDQVGNFVWLRREVESAGNHTQHWYDFNYSGTKTTNQLMSVVAHAGNTTTGTRGYGYDANGNQTSDNSSQLANMVYGRSNLPFSAAVGSDEISYFYDANDARIYKQKRNTGVPAMVVNKEYYLRDATGREIGVLDMNQSEWTWYVFGLDRFAKLKPKAAQQPKIYSGNTGSTGSGAVDWVTHDPTLDNFLNYTWQETDPLLYGHGGGNYPIQIVQADVSGQVRLFLGGQYDEFVNNNPSVQVQLLSSNVASSGSQHFTFKTTTGEVYDLPIMELTLDQGLPGVDTANVFMPSMAATPAAGKRFAYHSDTTLGDLIYYIHDHLGNTRVTYEPEVTNCGPQTITYLSRDSIYYESLEQWVYDTVWLISSSTNFTYTIQNAFDYYPYGKVLREYNANTEKYLSTHHERDEETGWDYRNARYSEADIPRFGQIDPKMTMYPSMSPYLLVAGNPISFVDMNGMNFTRYVDKNGVDVIPETADGSNDVVVVPEDKIDIFRESYSRTNYKLWNDPEHNKAWKSFLGFKVSKSQSNSDQNAGSSFWGDMIEFLGVDATEKSEHQEENNNLDPEVEINYSTAVPFKTVEDNDTFKYWVIGHGDQYFMKTGFYRSAIKKDSATFEKFFTPKSNVDKIKIKVLPNTLPK